jgi:ribulose-5-phosphate 4-epimerase/fuculose-1-phosphate aldolase
MFSLLKKYSEKLYSQGLAHPEKTAFLALDDRVYSLTGVVPSGTVKELTKVFDRMDINSLLYATPEEPYRRILKEVIKELVYLKDRPVIVPEDCETRTFFHDIPVIERLSADAVVSALSERKAAIVVEPISIVSRGSVSPEETFVSFSSTCFSTFVKYFYDHLCYVSECKNKGFRPSGQRLKAFREISAFVDLTIPKARDMRLLKGPPRDETTAIDMIKEAGSKVVSCRLVDSFFGNISLLFDNRIYISQTAASLDELSEAIDIIPLDCSSTAGITSSSELPTHVAVYRSSDVRFILHGHPRFAVIMSMYCDRECEFKGDCYARCPEQRSICAVPVVPGEIGAGPTGIVKTVPKLLKESDAVVVIGHGVFTTGRKDFNHPFMRMVEIEECCRLRYYKLVDI